MTIPKKGGRTKILKPKEGWKFMTFNLTPKEKKRFDKLCGTRTRIEFLLEMMDVFEARN